MPSALDLERATRIAEEYLERLNTNGEFQVILHRRRWRGRTFRACRGGTEPAARE